MSQNDFNLANQGFPSMRSDMNSALQALASNSAGDTEPSTMYAYQLWYDSTADVLKMRNSDNDAWITIATFSQTDDTTTDLVRATGVTASAVVPSGTTAQRDGSPSAGLLRFNSTTNFFEGYDGSQWGLIGGGGFYKGENGEVGSSAGDIFRINEQTLNTNVTIDADENANATGPLAVASGVTLTVTSGGNLSIV